MKLYFSDNDKNNLGNYLINNGIAIEEISKQIQKQVPIILYNEECKSNIEKFYVN